jgi:hypothetical protein
LFFPTAEGYVDNTVVNGKNNYSYVYNYTDHLGNIRVSYGWDKNTGKLKILEENNYYAFGLKHKNYNMSINKHKALLSEILPVNPEEVGIIGAIIGERPAVVKDYNYKYDGKEF